MRRLVCHISQAGQAWTSALEGCNPQAIEVRSYKEFHIPLSGGADFEILKAAFSAWGSGSSEPDDRGKIAEALFDVLVPPACRPQLFDGQELTNLALRVPTEMENLPWELVHGAHYQNKTLAAMGVTLTRLVDSPANAPESFERPMRILFVSGAELDDPAVRAGSEFYSIARNCKHVGLPFATRLLIYASLSELSEAVKAFKPHIVHFAGHGRADGLQFRPDEISEEGWYSAAEILTAFGEERPRIMLLSACDGGSTPMEASQLSLAVELVKGRVPIVTAASGKISDPAARLFSRSFMNAIASGDPLLESIAQTRRMAMAGNGFLAAAEWGRLGIFLDSSVPVGFAPAGPPTAAETLMAERLKPFAELDRNEPLLCQREAVWKAYSIVTNSGPQRTLLLYGAAKRGKGRMIRELVRQAIREGHLALYLVTKAPATAKSDAYDRVARAMISCLDAARNAFKLGWVPNLLIKALGEKLTLIDVPNQLTVKFSTNPKGLDFLAGLFAHEIRSLLKELRHQNILEPDSKAIVFADDLHELPPQFQEELVEPQGVLTQNGWASVDDAPIPFVAAVAVDGQTSALRKTYEEAGKMVFTLELKAFETENDMDMFCYERVLLSPFHSESDPPHQRAHDVFAYLPRFVNNGKFVTKEEEELTAIEHQKEMFRDVIAGEPVNLRLRTFYTLAVNAEKHQFMSASNEVALLKALEQGS